MLNREREALHEYCDGPGEPQGDWPVAVFVVAPALTPDSYTLT